MENESIKIPVPLAATPISWWENLVVLASSGYIAYVLTSLFAAHYKHARKLKAPKEAIYIAVAGGVLFIACAIMRALVKRLKYQKETFIEISDKSVSIPGFVVNNRNTVTIEASNISAVTIAQMKSNIHIDGGGELQPAFQEGQAKLFEDFEYEFLRTSRVIINSTFPQGEFHIHSIPLSGIIATELKKKQGKTIEVDETVFAGLREIELKYIGYAISAIPPTIIVALIIRKFM